MYLCNATKNQRSIHTPAFQYYLLGLPHWLHQRHVALGLKAQIHGNLVQLFHLTAGNLAGFKSTVSFCWGHWREYGSCAKPPKKGGTPGLIFQVKFGITRESWCFFRIKLIKPSQAVTFYDFSATQCFFTRVLNYLVDGGWSMWVQATGARQWSRSL